ncbi:hypothetical protein ACHAQG_006897 [Verticillium nonalfalfae]
MSESLLGYQTDLASQFGYDPLKVRASVYKWNSWAAIVINPNATALLQQAVETGNTSYDPTGVVQIIYQTPLWLIFWVMTNVSTLSYSMDLAPGSYHWGRA